MSSKEGVKVASHRATRIAENRKECTMCYDPGYDKYDRDPKTDGVDYVDPDDQW